VLQCGEISGSPKRGGPNGVFLPIRGQIQKKAIINYVAQPMGQAFCRVRERFSKPRQLIGSFEVPFLLLRLTVQVVLDERQPLLRCSRSPCFSRSQVRR
jgi:hypothetical protein